MKTLIRDLTKVHCSKSEATRLLSNYLKDLIETDGDVFFSNNTTQEEMDKVIRIRKVLRIELLEKAGLDASKLRSELREKAGI